MVKIAIVGQLVQIYTLSCPKRWHDTKKTIYRDTTESKKGHKNGKHCHSLIAHKIFLLKEGSCEKTQNVFLFFFFTSIFGI